MTDIAMVFRESTGCIATFAPSLDLVAARQRSQVPTFPRWISRERHELASQTTWRRRQEKIFLFLSETSVS